MAFKYLVVGPEVDSSEVMEKYLKEGHQPVLIEDGTTLRGRVFGEIVTIGNFERKWNWQDIWESIQIFKEQHPDKDLEDIDEESREGDFFDYGI